MIAISDVGSKTIRIHVIVYLCFDYHSVSNIIAILISNTMYGIGQDGASKAKRKKGRERCHVSGLWDPSLVPRPNASAAAGGLHHRYACKRSGDVIHPQLRCIGSGHETSSDHEVIAMKRLPFTQLQSLHVYDATGQKCGTIGKNMQSPKGIVLHKGDLYL